MSITVDTINLRFSIKPQYDQQQLSELQSDLKATEKEFKATAKEVEQSAKEYKKLNEQLRNMKDNRDRLAALKSRTPEEEVQLQRLNRRIAEHNIKVQEQNTKHGELLSTYRRQSLSMQQAQQKLNDYTVKIGLNKLSLNDLTQKQKELNVVVRQLKPGTEDFERYTAELQAVTNQIKETKEEIYGTKESLEKTGGAWKSFLGKINMIGFAITNAFAIKDRIVAWADQYVQSFAKMDDAMTDVMKYTGQTKAEVEDTNEAFKQMTTRTAREELNALAGAAGRLGIQGKENIVGFVDAADKINVALGDDLGEGAIDQIGKLTMVFGEDKTKGLNGAMLATGSAINVLGANSSANTGFITEFTSSMAGMAVNARITQTDIMGYASALSQAGIEGQTASGVFAQLITKMFTDPAKFAKAAHLDVKAFTDLLKTDANAAILQFLEGLKQNGGFDSLAPALKSLKMQGTQAVPVISSLINKMDELKKAQKDARQAYDEGTSIIEEFNNANSSAAAKLEMAQKAMNDAAASLGKQLMPIVENSIYATTSFVKLITPIVRIIRENITAFAQLATAIAFYSAAVNVAAIKTSLFEAKALLAAKATKIWQAAMTAGPLGLFAAGIALISTELIRYGARAYEAAHQQDKLNETMIEAKKEIASERNEMDSLIGIVRSATSSENERRDALEKLNGKLMSLHLSNLTEEQIRTGDLTTILDAYNRKLETQIKLKRLQAQQEELINQKIDLEEGGYKDDISFGDRIAQGFAATGQAMISGHLQGFRTAFDAEWGRVEESFKNRALRPIMEGLDTVQDKIAKIKSDEEKAANTIDYVGEVFVTGGNGNKDGGSDGGSSGSASSKKGGSDKELQQQEALLKAAHEREMLLLRQQYEGKEHLADEWHQKQFAEEERYLVELAKIRADHDADESKQVEMTNQLLDLGIKKANYEREAEKRRLSEELKSLDRQQSAEEISLAQQRLNGQIGTEKEYSLKKLEIEKKYQAQRLAILKEGSDEYRAAQKQMIQLELQEKEQFQKSYYDTGNQSLQDVMSDLGSFDERLEMNQAYYDADLINFEQYQQNKTAIVQEQTEARQEIQQAAIEVGNQALQAAQQMFQVMQQRETAAVDAKYKKLIASAKKQGKDTTKLEEQQEAEKMAIKKKYAQKEFQMKVLQIVSSTAMAIADVWSKWAGTPYVAAALTAVAAAMGAVQLASAKAAADQAAGLYEGGYNDDYQEGYTRKGDPRKQAGVIPVHRSEFVANHKAVANPEVRPVLDVIDRHQKVGDISMLNSTRMLEEAYGRGRYRGGYTRISENGNSWDNEDTPSDPTSTSIIDILRRIEGNTSDALTVKEVRDAIRRQERLERNASR